MTARRPLALAASLGLCAALTAGLSGCGGSWPPPRLANANIGGNQDYSLGRTALRGAGYKRLIPTYAETHGLLDALDDLEAETSDSGKLAEIAELRADTEAFRDEIRFKLDTRRREKWHRVQMGRLWDRYRELGDETAVTLHAAYKRERRVDFDEIRDRRTPLTGEMRFTPFTDAERWRRNPWEMNMYAEGGETQIPKTPRWRGPWEYPDENGPVSQAHWGPDFTPKSANNSATNHHGCDCGDACTSDACDADCGDTCNTKHKAPRSGSYAVPAEPAPAAPKAPPAPKARPERANGSNPDVTVTRDRQTDDDSQPDPVIDLVDP